MIDMDYEWDPRKRAPIAGSTGIDFADAVTVFSDPLALTIRDDYPDEERFITLGMDALGRLLVVIYTWRGEYIRVISARKATRPERKQYEG